MYALATITAVVIKSLVSPLAAWVPKFYPEHPFTCTAVTLFLSGLVSLVGLSEIIRLTAPVLDIIHPPSIVNVIFIAIVPSLKGARAGAAVVAVLWGLFEGLCGYARIFETGSAQLAFRNYFPGAEAGFGWVLIASIGAIIGHFIIKNKKQQKHGDGSRASYVNH